MKKVIKLVLFFQIVLFLTGCGYKGYSGKHDDLYTESISSLLWNYGHSYGADYARDSEINIIEEDTYGRRLFIYYERLSVVDSSIWAILISQATTDGSIYYYEDVNFIVIEQPSYRKERNEFSNESIELLKIDNDWNKEINYSNCISKKVSRHKLKLNSTLDSQLNDSISNYVEDVKRSSINLEILTYDKDNSIILYGSVRNSEEEIKFVIYVTIANDLIEKIDFLVLQNFFDYRTDLVNFKNSNRELINNFNILE